MRMATRMSVAAAMVMAALAGPVAFGADGAPAAGTVVLDNRTGIRVFMGFQTPQVMTAGGELRTALTPGGKTPKPMAEYRSPLPPDGWAAPEFNASAWDRRRAPVELRPKGATGGRETARHSATVNSLICVRANVMVTDPTKAADLRLSLRYVGGAVVYLNGKEIARGHLPAGAIKPDTPAEKYPDDLYRLPDGKFLSDTKKYAEAFAKRYRRLEAALPQNALRKGGNVLAIEIHRAPVNEGAVKAKRVPSGGMRTVRGIWAYAALNSMQVVSASGAGVAANVARPKGVQVWNVAPFETIEAFSYGDPGEILRPVIVHAARNSTFSGRLAVSADKAISGLKVAVTDLKAKDGSGSIPASAVQVRYAEPTAAAKSWVPSGRFDGLLDTVPAEVAVIKARPPRGAPKTLTAGAVASLWFTVRTPADAKPGAYEGAITVEADGLAPTTTPLQVTVSPWKMADPADFRQHHLICPSPESVAKHYGVPLWSDKHFELMGKSLALLAEVSSRRIPVNLAIDFYGTLSNSETMVRWIRQPDGSYKHDFSLFDRYLDLVAKQCGKPNPLRLNCWGELGRNGKNGAAAMVSRLDPATGKIEPMPQPLFGSEESYRFWKPVIDEALKRLKARGWIDVTAFGHNSYCYPVKPQIVDVAHRLWPEGVWAYSAHNGTLGGRWKGSQKGVMMPIKWSLSVWNEGRLSARGYAGLLKPRPGIWCTLARTRHYDRSPLIIFRNLPEEAISRNQDGVGEFGAESFPIPNPKRRGRYFNLSAGRGTGGGNNASTRSLLAPGPDGPISTERFEMYREGVQLSEGILYLQRAVTEGKISGALAGKVNAYLDTRGREFIQWWSRGTSGIGFVTDWSIPGQFDRDAELLALAGEVAAQ